MIIGLSGHIKSGKTTAASIIKKLNPSFTEKYFAYKLKLIASILTGDEIKLFETQEGKDGFLDDWNMSRRKMLQNLGTEILRNQFDQNIWIKALFADYRPQFGGNGMTDYDLTQVYPNWIISDVRFVNEAIEIKNRGGKLIRVNRPFSLIYPEDWEAFVNYATWAELNEIDEENFKEFLKDFNPELHKKITHISETDLDSYYDFDLVIENTKGFEEFENQIFPFLHQ